MAHPFAFNEKQFNRLFPFYILIDRDLQITGMGKSLNKLCALGSEKKFSRLFRIPRPFTPFENFDDLRALENQLVVLESAAAKKIMLRGQFEFLDDTAEILFVGSPWFSSMEQVTENNLVINDFAKHDPLINLLHVLKTQEITNEDLKQLLTTVNTQKKELQKANKEIHDIALFPTQNPDPLIRIDYNGEILQNNPAAAPLNFFAIDNKTYRREAFFKLVAEKIDKTNPRWIIEARSNGKDYSFVCVSMAKEGYINIYGSDITQQNKDRRQLERLSLVASANDNGVLFASPDGLITWVNEGLCKLTGFTPEEIIGKAPVDLYVGPLTDQDTLGKILDAFFTGEAFSTEIIYYRKDKSWFWGRTVSQPIKDKDGKITEFFGIIQDVTHEKTSQERLKVLSQIAEANVNAVVIADKEGKIVWVNQSFVDITGYSLEEAIGKKPGHLLQGPETDKETVRYLREQINANEPFSAEIINYSKSGNKYWLRVQGQPIKNDKGEVTGFFALEEDITKEKESEGRFRKALENIGDNVWEHDFRTGKTYFSKSENEFLGYTTDEFTNNQQLWWDSVVAEDRPILTDTDRSYRRGEIDSHSLEYRIRHKDGYVKWVLDRGVVIEKDRAGKPLRITGTHTDITTRKEFEQTLKANEEKYRGIIANMNLGLMEMDANARIVFLNQSLLNMTGLSQEEALGFDARNFLAEESLDQVEPRLRKRALGVSEAYELQTNIQGNKGWWFVSSAPNYAPNGEYIGSIVICLDITNQKVLEKELIRSKQEAERLAKTKETFLANMSHEIRTPMNAIIGMGNQLAKTSLSPQQQFYLNTINAAAENLLVIINDILDLSKIDAGKLSIEKIGFEPRKVLANAMQVMMHKAEEKGLKITNAFCDKRVATVLIGDPYRLNQVLLNLLSNAVKFTEKGAVNVSCSVISETDEAQTLEVKVMDTGIGMDKEFANKLFEKFSQEYESISRKYGGTGLGMSICRELIDLMGGTISVESTKGKGTTVAFTIALKKGTSEDITERKALTVSTDTLKGKTILVTDDNEMNRLVALTILESYGATIIEAENGEEAVAAVNAGNIDLVLMDIQMPVLNGFDASKAIRSHHSAIPIIALTANAIKGESEKCLAAGMNDYIAKPFQEDEFLAKIAHWLGGSVEVSSSPLNTSLQEASPLYDLSGLKEISKGNPQFVHKMVNIFCEQAPQMLEQLKQAYASGDWEKMRSVAHKFKPSIDNLQILPLKKTIREIEQAGNEQAGTSGLEAQMLLADEVIKKVVRQLQHEYS